MIHYENEKGKNLSIETKGSIVKIGAFSFHGREIPEKEIDLSTHQGETVRVYLDEDNTFSMAHGTHEWLLFMANVPEKKYKTVSDGQDENGMERSHMEEIPLDLSEVGITAFALPEDEEEE